MMASVSVRLTGRQYKVLKSHLYPGDGKEAIALLLAGRRRGDEHHVLCVREVIPLPHDECFERTEELIRWPTTRLRARLEEVTKRNWAVIKVHSHPGGYPTFSMRDDGADRELFESIFGWTDSTDPHASLVMLPDGRLFGRAVFPPHAFDELRVISVAGDDLKLFFDGEDDGELLEALRRNEQTFGRGTTSILRKLRIGVVGCSGTGSPVIEQLARLGVGGLVLVDPDTIEEKNLNRILNSTWKDAIRGRPKVEVLARSIRDLELGTEVTTFQEDLARPHVVRSIAECDVVFGCMDGSEGRQLLNRLAAFYVLPYIDVGVRLVADGQGGVSHICGSVHYLQPDGSSLMSRGAITEKQLRAEALRRESPEEYAKLHGEGYIAGVAEERPAVLPVNMLYASLAVNEFLARLHGYRLEPNGMYARVMLSLEQMEFYTYEDGDPCSALVQHVGRGDVVPLLDRPALSERLCVG
jgi:hypothetical protein